METKQLYIHCIYEVKCSMSPDAPLSQTKLWMANGSVTTSAKKHSNEKLACVVGRAQA